MENAIVSRNADLNLSLLNIKDRIYEAARANLDVFLEGSEDDFTELEKEAMVRGEALKLSNDFSLAEIMIKYEILAEIRDAAYFSVHPNQYISFEEMAADNGMQKSEVSDIIQFVETIFPFIEENLGTPVAAYWEEIGKTKFRELVPYLRRIITGEASTSERVNDVWRNISEEIIEANSDLSDEEVRVAATAQLLDFGAQLPRNELRRQLNREQSSVYGVFLNVNGRTFFLSELDADERLLFLRKMGTRLEYLSVDLPQDEASRQIEAMRIPQLRELIGRL